MIASWKISSILGVFIFGSSIGKNGSSLGTGVLEQVRLSEPQALQSTKEASWSGSLVSVIDHGPKIGPTALKQDIYTLYSLKVC